MLQTVMILVDVPAGEVNIVSNEQGRVLESKKQQFTYSEGLSITNNFASVIAKGGFGTVYHGYLDGFQVAVKMLSPSSVLGCKEFQVKVGRGGAKNFCLGAPSCSTNIFIKIIPHIYIHRYIYIYIYTHTHTHTFFLLYIHTFLFDKLYIYIHPIKKKV